MTCMSDINFVITQTMSLKYCVPVAFVWSTNLNILYLATSQANLEISESSIHKPVHISLFGRGIHLYQDFQ